MFEVEFISLKVDEKGRIHLPKELREELGIEDSVLAEKRERSLKLISRKKAVDPFELLASIRIKTKKTPLQMKREAQKAMMNSV